MLMQAQGEVNLQINPLQQKATAFVGPHSGLNANNIPPSHGVQRLHYDRSGMSN